MRRAIKTKGRIIQAYQLCKNHPVLEQLMNKGLIKEIGNDQYEVFSQEALNGMGKGERAHKMDFIKIDSTGRPYPSSADYVAKTLKHLDGENYIQTPEPVYIWTEEDPMCPEIEYLIKNKGLVIGGENEQQYYSAPLWGTVLSAKKDAIIVFYFIEYNNKGEITDVDFNFVAYDEFQKTYQILDRI